MIPRSVPSYGDWSLAVIYTLVFAMLAFLLLPAKDPPRLAGFWSVHGLFGGAVC